MFKVIFVSFHAYEQTLNLIFMKHQNYTHNILTQS